MSTCEIDTAIIQRPVVHVHGASPAGPLGGLINVQERLDRFVAQLPGWHTLYTCLQTEQAKILLPLAFQDQTHGKPEKNLSLFEMALLYTLCPGHPAQNSLRLDAMLIRDGVIYADYLTQLLRVAIDTVFP